MSDELTARFVIMQDYGCEGWQIVGHADSMLEICRLREAWLRSAGSGRCDIFERFDPFDAYAKAKDELQ